ncbi:AAA family ATPase [Mesorhizobium sp. 1B3]|uniref:adenylate/guanylate cyclase domain-containing protein n=1 Tax=Mesorhizobium sp. 1B3 TaxID=3243599 RepID=UPI003D99E555
MDIGDWLGGLGLQSYEQAFRSHAVDMEVLPLLTVDDLKEIGIAAVGHRRRILDAIKLLQREAGEHAARGSAERRQLTLVFVDLVGSTELSARLDPEELGEMLQSFRDLVAGEIVRFEGHVAKFLGDGVLAYFGWPRASEDAAERAIRAGLAITKALADMAGRSGELLSARIGIATGLVVVGDLIGAGPTREEVAGDTPNLAARLQQVAQPNGVVIGESTRRLVGSLFELAGPDIYRLKGFAEPVTAWRVVGEGGADNRFEALHGIQLTPLVGRSEELEAILSGWGRAKQGDGQVVLICGEAGIGKSRLVHALREALKAEPITWIGYDCSPQHSSSALHPFIAQIERAAQFAPGDTRERRLKLLDSYLREGVGDVPGDEVALLADLLGLSNGASDPDLSPEERKARLFQSLFARLEGMAKRGPLLIVLEDAHWLDPTSGELFAQMVQRLRFLPALLAVTSRPEFSPEWSDLPHVTSVRLERLPPLQAKSLIERVAKGKTVPPVVLDRLLERTEGVPLFAEELTRAVLETGLLRDCGDRYMLSGPLPSLAIPATLQDSLMARLDRLAPVKEIAQIGACIGREFGHQLLAAVAPLPERDLTAALDRLADAGIIFRRGAASVATYVFKHALVRDAAYESLLKRRRQELHEQVATALLEQFPQLIEVQPELVARHLGEAGLLEKAVPYWLQAGRRAAARSANVEAIAHLNAGMDSLQALPPGEPRSRLELSLQLALGGPLLATRGFASSEAEAAYQRAQELSRELRSPGELFVALRGLGFVYHVRANLREATALADETVALAEQSGEPGLLTEGYHLAGALTFHLGRFQTARRWLDRSMEAGENHGRYHSEIYGMNMGVFCRAYIGHCDWHLGYPARALRSAEDGLAIAREVSHPFSIALALSYLAMLRQFRREPQAALELAEEAQEMCAKFGFDYYQAWSDLVHAWAVAEIRHSPENLTGYQRALESFRRTGAGLRYPYYLGTHAAMHRQAGDAATGLTLVEAALAAAETSHESWCNAELHRERGELLLAGPAKAELLADAEFQTAIEIAAAQGAKLPELRATVARARLLAARGDWRKAKETLSPIYRWFGEGLETPDMIDAQHLLADLQ